MQKPRIPIWVVGAWPSEKFIRRALRYDGLFPQELKPIEGTRHNARQAMPDTLRQMKVFVEARRAETTPFDIAVEGETPGGDPEQAAAVVREWAEAGATWWIEANWSALDQSDGIDAVTRRIALGPPGV